MCDIIMDPACDPENPQVIRIDDVLAAQKRLDGSLQKTLCTVSHLEAMTGMKIYFKRDFMLFTGSFKERGARNTLLQLSEEQRNNGVIAASAGNHALALAYHGQSLNVPVTVVMPHIAPMVKVERCRQFGANVIMCGNDLSESKTHAMQLVKEHHLTYINGYDHPMILAGQGTMGLEILEQVPDVDAVLVAVGGAGMLAGIAVAIKALKPSVLVYGVESDRCASLTEALKAGRPVHTRAEPTLADGLAVPMVGVNAFATLKPLVDRVIVVHEEHIALAILRLIEMEKAVVEGAGAVGLAAVLGNLVPELQGKKVVIPLGGGNIDVTVLGRCIERGLAVDGRLSRVVVTVCDRPGGIAELTQLIASIGVSLKHLSQDRAWLKSEVFSVQATCVVETRDKAHRDQLEQLLKSKYHNVMLG